MIIEKCFITNLIPWNIKKMIKIKMFQFGIAIFGMFLVQGIFAQGLIIEEGNSHSGIQNSQGGGYLWIGDQLGPHLSFDPYGMQSRQNNTSALLRLNWLGGNVNIGSITSEGNLGIGVTIAQAPLHLSDNAELVRLNYEAGGHGYISFYEFGSRRAWLGFSSDGQDDLYFTNEDSGDIFLYNNPGFLKITQAGELYTNENGLKDIGDKKNMQYNSSTGEIGYDNSSRRYKTNIQTLKDDWSKILEARPVRYTRPDSPDCWEYGFIAEEIDSIGLTNLVGYDAEGIPDDVKYDRMVLYLNEIVKNQEQQIKILKEQNVRMEKRVIQLEKEIYE